MSNGYNFYFKDGGEVLTFPITPPKLTIKIGSKNKVVTLIGEGDINILKSPSLTEIEFEARFPMRKYPYSREVDNFRSYFDTFKSLKEEKRSFRFIVARTSMKGRRTWDTNILVALEDFEVKESADEGDDVLITFNLKQYKDYGVKKLNLSKYGVSKNNTKTRSTENKGSSSSQYTVKSGDCLWKIAKQFYGNGAEWGKIYSANQSAIEADAKKHGRSSSSNGHWVFPGLQLTIPSK